MKFFIFLFVLLIPFKANARINIEARVNRNIVPLNEQVELELTVAGEAKNIPAPRVTRIEGFQIAGSGRSQNISIINGKMSSSYTYKYVLSPVRTGEFTIPSFVLSYKGKEYQTEPLKIKVVKSREYEFAETGKSQPGRELPEIFVEQMLDRKKAYIGEQVTYTFKFYRRIKLMSNPSFDPPDFRGFLKEDLPPNRSYRTRIKNREYIVAEIKYGLFPVKSGTFEIPPARLVITIDDFFFGNDFFARFFSEGKRKTLSTNNLTLNVLPLPEENKPAEFSGAVGVFDINARLDKETVKQGEPVTLEVKISGKGDLRTMNIPELPGLNNFRVYETVRSVNIDKKNYTVAGSKIFRTLIVPQVSGRINIPGISFSYFDPEKKEYRVKKSIPMVLEVTRSLKVSEKGPDSSVLGELQIVREDIRYIASDLGRSKTPPLYRKKRFWLIEGIPVYVWILFILIGILHKKVIEPMYPEMRKKRQIYYNIKKARKLADEENYIEVYKKIEEISKHLKKTPPELQEIIDRARAGIYSSDKNNLSSAKQDLNKFIRIVKKSLKVLIPLLFILSASTAESIQAVAGAEELFKKANEYYKHGKFNKSVILYIDIINKNGEYEGLCYNLGNSYWRTGNIGKARLYWEKALKLNPGNKDAAYNIELIIKTLDEKKEIKFLNSLSNNIGAVMSLNNLVILVSVLGWGFLFSFLAYYLKRKESLMWIGVSMCILFLISFGILWLRIEVSLNTEEGIIVEKAEIYSSPGRETLAQGTVPEGKKVVIIESLDEWVAAGIKDKNLKFWIAKEKINKI